MPSQAQEECEIFAESDRKFLISRGVQAGRSRCGGAKIEARRVD